MEEFENLTLDMIIAFQLNEDACRRFLEYVRWQGHPWCPHCTYTHVYHNADGTYRCANKRCQRDFTVTVGTIFHGTRTPLRTWFYALYRMLAEKGISANDLHEKKRIHIDTAWNILHSLREMMVVKDEDVEQLEGVHEFDDYEYGPDKTKMSKSRRKKIKQRGGYAHKTPVLCMVTRGQRYAGVVMPQNTNGAQTKEVIEQYLSPSSTAYSDCAPIYHGLGSYFEKYSQFNHSKGIHGDGEGGHTNTVNWLIRKIQEIDDVHLWVSPRYLQRYIDMVMFKENCRLSGMGLEEMFVAAFKNINRPITRQQLKMEAMQMDIELKQNLK